MTDHERRRERMVDRDLVGRDIIDPAVLEAMRTVPREAFVTRSRQRDAYDDRPLTIGSGQTISQPYIVALMAQALEPTLDDLALEIGTGSGYAAAVLSLCVREVVTVERLSELAASAETTCRSLGYDNISFCTGDGTLGWEARSPYDAIVVTAAGPDVPQPLLDQLKVGGRLVMPTGGRFEQRLIRVRRTTPERFVREDLGGVTFVPLIGDRGW